MEDVAELNRRLGLPFAKRAYRQPEGLPGSFWVPEVVTVSDWSPPRTLVDAVVHSACVVILLSHWASDKAQW
jgi:hypothetical protein